MKKRVWLLVSLLLLLPLLLLIFAFALPAQYGKTYLAALNDKAAILEKTASPKIVIIGGSGAAFDVDCELLESQLPGYRAVNFGLYAGLGTTVMLELSLPSLQEGDIVVFSPELSEQTLSDWFSADSMWQAAEENPALLLRLHPDRWEKLLAAFPRYAAQKARFWLLGSAPEGSGVYARSAFTEKGDLQKDLRLSNQMPGGWDENMPLRFDPALPTEDFMDRVNTFTTACEKKGVRVCFRFCPMNAAALAEGEAERMEAFEAQLKEALRCEVIGTAARALMEPGWFFDTNFHLNGAGTILNTVLLAEDLKQWIGDDTPVTVTLPSMPGSAEKTITAGDNADADCFTYEKQQNGYILTGLTEAGKQRKKITVPVSYNGLPVLSFEKTVFAGNTFLRELTLQSNLRVIPDDAFNGCSLLETIILLQDDPGQCTVGSALLNGTDAMVAVPAERYGNYCTNYFWSVHAARLRPLEAQPTSTPAPTTAPVTKSVTRIRYEGNGGTLRGSDQTSLTREITYAHLRENTLQGTVWFEREGYVLTGWNTQPDGSGLSVGLGSRMEPTETLYAQWLACSPEEDFDWETDGSTASVTGWHGTDRTCVLPQTHDGLPVRTIRAGAFQDNKLSLLVLSPAIRIVEAGAFSDCEIKEMILYDNLKTISDACFVSCSGPSVLHVNAATAPVYSGSYFDTFQDKYDYLLSLQGKQKLVLASGSSGRYGYDSTLLKKAFPDLEPVNMGVYAFTNALPQLRLMLPQTEAGDILLYAPEFDAIAEQFCVTNRLDTGFWAMMESNYDAAATLDMRSFTGVFDSLGEYLSIRSRMPGKDYAVSSAHYDDDGNFYPFSTYNPYGDFILPRPLGDTDERLRHNIADYTVNSFPLETVQSLNAALAPFVEKGVSVYFTYTPRNVNSLTEASTPEARRALHEWLKDNLEFPVISKIEDSLLSGRYFWLIDSHTGTDGARIRTERVIADLLRCLSGSRNE